MNKPGKVQMLLIDKKIVLVGRKYRSKWWEVTCCGCSKKKRRKDGSCAHERQTMDILLPEIKRYARVRPRSR
ncbi:MAG: hypothetical protein M0R02_12945 [Bacteroidales bacterium]|nr:hypothetical protein [Bacteroidales bacterium]